MYKSLITMIKLAIPVGLIGIMVLDIPALNLDDRPLAFVRKFKPNVEVINQQIESISKRGEPLFNGDTLQTNQNGFALVQFMDKSLAKVTPNSELLIQGEVQNDTRQNVTTQIGLRIGEIFLSVQQQDENEFQVTTNVSVATVKGTEFGATADDYYWVVEGEVEIMVRATGETVTLTENMFAQVNGDGSIETGTLTDDEIEQRNEKYTDMEANLESETIRLRFVDENGQEQVIELQVFDN